MTDQWIDDGDLRKYRIEIPNIVDDLGLTPRAFRLYVHAKRVTGASNGVCYQSTKTLAQACKMSVGLVSQAKQELIEAGLIEIEKGDQSKNQADRIRIVDIWRRNFLAYAPDHGGDSAAEIPRSYNERPRSYNEHPRSLYEHPRSLYEPKKEPFKNIGNDISNEVDFGFQATPKAQINNDMDVNEEWRSILSELEDSEGEKIYRILKGSTATAAGDIWRISLNNNRDLPWAQARLANVVRRKIRSVTGARLNVEFSAQ